MKRGFTIVEILVVIIVLAILAVLTVTAYTTYVKRGEDASAKSMASIVKSAVERYYIDNNEYPTPASLGASSTETPPSSYTTASQKINIPLSTLDTSSVKFVPCYNTSRCTNPYVNKKHVYYIAKAAYTETGTVRTISMLAGSTTCTYTIPTTEVGTASFLLAFWSTEDNRWNVVRSIKGSPTTSSTTNCPFREL